MADDAGALLVRSGLVSAEALADARARVADAGGTVGEQLVAAGVLGDDVLTDFYKHRLLVPQVNPNTLARLTSQVIELIPGEMAIELRAVPVSLDTDNNLTVAMSDPSNRHAVDEIGSLTGAYVVRAVATQMQIAWCLAHYYGHLTELGQRLLQPTASAAGQRAIAAAVRRGPARDTQPSALFPDDDAQPPGDPTKKLPGATRLPAQAVVPGDPTKKLPGATRLPARAAPPPLPGAPEPAPEPVTDPAPEPVAATSSDGVPQPRSLAESRTPLPRAGSIKPPLPQDDDEPDDDAPEVEISIEPSAPVISIEIAPAMDDANTEPNKRPVPKRRRPAEPDPPELAARAGEVDMKAAPMRAVPVDEPRVVIADEIEPPAIIPAIEVSGEIGDSNPAVIIAELPLQHSEPVLLERRRVTAEPAVAAVSDDSDVVMLATKKARARSRVDRDTDLGIGMVPAATRAREHAVPGDDDPTTARVIEDDRTRLDMVVAPAVGDDTSSSDALAAPPSPMADQETSPLVLPPMQRPEHKVPPPSGKVSLDHVRQRAVDADDGLGSDTDTSGLLGIRAAVTNVMSEVELDRMIPERTEDPADDGWGKPGTTIPPPLLGAIPGSLEPESGIIPMPNIDSEPLIVAPPAAPETARGKAANVSPTRALEDATARALDLIRTLDRATDRDEVIAWMVDHLAATHQRAGFFVTRAGELSLFKMVPRPAAVAYTTLRLDRPSTLQDVVGTRLPYRGPVHDDASRSFLTQTLGTVPSELLLVPIAVRERVVGVLFGVQRKVHTFDDQLALAARAAGIALERILKGRRGR